MFKIDSNKKIYLTRGDVACIRIGAKNSDGSDYKFQIGDIIRFKVFKKKDCDCVVLQKDTKVEAVGLTVDVELASEETKIGDIIHRHVEYWYEVELNPDTSPQTIIGYEINEETGKPEEKIFVLLPEGSDN